MLSPIPYFESNSHNNKAQFSLNVRIVEMYINITRISQTLNPLSLTRVYRTVLYTFGRGNSLGKLHTYRRALT